MITSDTPEGIQRGRAFMDQFMEQLYPDGIRPDLQGEDLYFPEPPAPDAPLRLHVVRVWPTANPEWVEVGGWDHGAAADVEPRWTTIRVRADDLPEQQEGGQP